MLARPQDYFRSLSAELDVQANRVRSLIGDAHWLSDGGHKEALVRGFVTRHVPHGTVVGRGFLIRPESPTVCSREQDVLVLNTTNEPPLFNIGGLLVTSSAHAYACLSVKSAFGKKEFLDSLDGFLSVPENTANVDLFFGSYHFGTEEGSSLAELGERVSGWLDGHDRAPMIARVSSTTFLLLEVGARPHRLRLYATESGSTAFFIARLVNHITARRSKEASAFADALDASDACTDFHEIELP